MNIPGESDFSDEIVIDGNLDSANKITSANISDVNNILTFVRDTKDNQQTKSEFSVEIKSFINQINKLIEKDDQLVYITLQLFCKYISSNLLLLRKDPLLCIVVKSYFYKLIINHKHFSLISEYNKIYNDEIFNDVEESSLEYKFSQEEINDLIDKHKHNISHLLDVKNRKKKYKYNFALKEIVGVRANDGKWWMSQIVDILETTDGKKCYYIEYLGWGNEFNEFIPDGTWRIKPFNPRKHKYYRPYWKTKTSDSK